MSASTSSSAIGTASDWLAAADRLAPRPGAAPSLGLSPGFVDELAVAVVVVGLLAWIFLVLLRPLSRGRPRTALAASLAVGTVGALALWNWVAIERPTLGLALAAAPLLALLFRLGQRVGPWLSGLSLVIRGHVGVGDLVEVGPVRGELVEGGLLRARLVTLDGVDVFVPWSAFADEVRTRSAAAPRVARVHVDFETPPSPEERRQLEVRAALCPYRVWTRPVLIRPDPERPVRLDVELWSWSEESARLAEDFIRRAARRDTQSEPGQP